MYDVYFSFEIYPGNHIENVDIFWDFAFGVFIIWKNISNSNTYCITNWIEFIGVVIEVYRQFYY